MTFLAIVKLALLMWLSSATAFTANPGERSNKVYSRSNTDMSNLRTNSAPLLSFAQIGIVSGIQIRGGASAASTSSLTSVPTLTLMEVCGIAAPIASVFLSFSGLPTVRKIIKDKSVGDLPLLPYSSLVANSFVWLTYGLLKREAKVWSCNSCSILLGLYYFASFAKYSPKKSSTLPGSVAQHKQVCAGAILATLAIAASMSRTKAASMLGTAGVCICIALFASPLAALKTVFKTKSAESIPLPFAIFTTFNCLLWSILGVFDMKDVNIWLPNVLGLVCGVLQIALKLIFGDDNKGLVQAKQAA